MKNIESLYFASVDEVDGSLIESGSRTLAAIGVADTIALAEKTAEESISNVKGPLFYRKDIGRQNLLNRRIENMRKLRC